MCKPTVPFDSLLSPMTRRALYFCHQLCLTKQLAGFLQALWLCLAWCPQQVPHVPACLTIMHFKHCNVSSSKLSMQIVLLGLWSIGGPSSWMKMQGQAMLTSRTGVIQETLLGLSAGCRDNCARRQSTLMHATHSAALAGP